MVHITYDTSATGYDAFFVQNGCGLGEESSYQVFKGAPPYQRGWGATQNGAGIGDIFRGLWRFFLPLVRRAGDTVADEALQTGKRFINRVIEERPNFRGTIETLTTEGKRGADNVLEKGGLKRQFGTGARRKRIKANKSSLLSHQTLIGKTITKPLIQSKKRLRSDAFGLY